MIRTPMFAAFLLALVATHAQAALPDHFESPAVHPLELSPDGMKLFAAHTADQRITIFDLSGSTPVRVAEIPVGMEPVSVRAHGPDQVWAVNHLSDSISLVDLTTGNVIRTLNVGDEPTDVVFAGSPERAFVCLSQEDRILVLDPTSLDAPGTSIPLEGSDPRSLAVSADGSTVYVTILDSGNQTTTVPRTVVSANGGLPAPNPPMAAGLPPAPETGLIVRNDGSAWRDETGADWSATLGYTLLDNDVIAIDANTLSVQQTWNGVGTHIFNVAVHPLTGDLVVTNQEAHSEVRFEPNLQGVFANSRVGILGSGGSVLTEDLNPHINTALPGDPGTRALSVSLPLDIVIAPDGGAMYVASFGSAKVAVLSGAGTVQRRISVGDGPAGLALDGDRLYVLERDANNLAWVDLLTDSVDRMPLGFDPTPADVRDGRKIFYDAANSKYGDLSCATCHLFGGMDNLAWDLGNPLGSMTPPPAFADPFNNLPDFHPMKGPMITQSLKETSGTEPLHWRGDRASLADFNGAFVALLGADSELGAIDFGLFETFLSSMRYPPNPFLELNGDLPPTVDGGNPTHGRDLYLTGGLVGVLECNSCHVLPTGESALIIPGSALQEPEGKVVPQLRNLYEKTRFNNEAPTNVRGFGYTADGSVDDLFSFLQFRGFSFNSDQDRIDVVAFLLSFDSGTHPGVGAQWTARGVADPQGEARLAILETAADLGQIELIAKGRAASGLHRGWVYAGAGNWTPDQLFDTSSTSGELLAAAGPGTEITFTGVLVGNGQRMGIDRDEDGALDTDEVVGGGDPGDPAVQPAQTPTAVGGSSGLSRVSLRITGRMPVSSAANFLFSAPRGQEARVEVFDLRGRRIQTLLSGTATGEPQELGWNLRDAHGRAVSSGLYLLRASTGIETTTARVVVVR